MRIKTINGSIKNVTEVITAVEQRQNFNGTKKRLFEPCKDGSVKPNALVFALANMAYDDLADDLKDEILGCRFSIFCLEDCTDEEVEEIFTRLNNSTPLSPIQKCRSIMSSELASWTKEICKKDFFQHSLSLSVAQIRRESDLEVLLQSMLLLDSRHEGYDWKGISTSDVTKYCSHVRGRYTEDKRKMILEIVDFLGDAFKEQHKFLKKSNVPTVIVLAKLALESHIEPERFKGFIDAFNNSLSEEYIANTGSGNVKRAKTDGRLFAIADDFDAFFDLESASILGNNRGSNSDGNSEVTEDLSSSEEDMSEAEVSGEAESEIEGDENSEITEDLPSSEEDMPENDVFGETESDSDEGEIESEDAEPVEDADNIEAGEEEAGNGEEDQGIHDEDV